MSNMFLKVRMMFIFLVQLGVRNTKMKHILNSKVRNFIVVALIKSKNVGATTLAHEETSQVKDCKINILVHQYELFKMKEPKTINLMFGRFQTIINNLNILKKLNVTMIISYNQNSLKFSDSGDLKLHLFMLQDLKNLPIEELPDTFNVHEIEMREDEGQRKGKSIAFKSHKAHERLLSKAFKTKESSDKKYEEDSDIDELSFIFRKIYSMWKKGGSIWKNYMKNFIKETKDKN
ncbi:hypothetical protein CR513_24042, partial [Mucuna pruriens]